MKKILFYFTLYIGIIFPVFNQSNAQTDMEFLAQNQKEQNISYEYKIINEIKDIDNTNNLPKNQEEDYEQISDEESILKSSSPTATLIMLPFIIEKIYPDERIDGNLKPILRKIYPSIELSTLNKLEGYVKIVLNIKKRYNYIINRLQHLVKASKIMPQDAPIIAKEGEYAPIDPTLTKESKSNEYQVKYEPYKYLEYDTLEYGEPVRRMDKNYDDRDVDSNEILLAILKFDLPALYKALKNTPAENDGSREKINKLDRGIRSRILLDTSSLGNKEKILGVIEIYLPNGLYIAGDYLNPLNKPYFTLQENKKEELNIKSYKLYQPESISVTHNNEAKRIFVGYNRFPIEIYRQNLQKGLKIKGKFNFKACDINHKCQLITSNHEISLPPSDIHEYSIHNNFVTQGFARIPKETSNNVKLKNINYNEQNNQLTLTFKSNKLYSNIAVMAEDKVGTNYINPRYNINNYDINVTFDVNPTPDSLTSPQSSLKGGDIAITALFNEKESIRVVTASQNTTLNSFQENLGALLLSAFIFGLLLNLMPGIFNIFIRLSERIIWRKNSHLVYIRYAIFSAISWLIFAYIFKNKDYNSIYANPWLSILAIIFVSSNIIENLKYMDFSLFRPLKKFFKKGCMSAIFSVILITAFPMPLSDTVIGSALVTNAPIYKILTFVWLGQITLPLLVFMFKHLINFELQKLQPFNFAYNTIYLIFALWITFAHRGIYGLFIALSSIIIFSLLWYIYPQAITETVKHTRSKNIEKELFSTVQKHFSIASLVCYLILGLLMSQISLKTTPIISVSKAQQLGQTINQEGKPLLVTIEGCWSLSSIMNKIIIHKLKNKGVKIISTSHIGKSATIDEWLKTYGKLTSPLNVLFTPRHPNGLSLPTYLKDIEWDKATTIF